MITLRQIGPVARYAGEFAAAVTHARTCLRRARYEASPMIAEDLRKDARQAGQYAREWWAMLTKDAGR